MGYTSKTKELDADASGDYRFVVEVGIEKQRRVDAELGSQNFSAEKYL